MKQNRRKRPFVLNTEEWVFDHVVSLGSTCQVAYQLQRHGLRVESFPFDWLFSTNTEKVIEAFESDFQDRMLESNLVESENTETEHRRVVDTKYDTVIQHHFPLDKPLKASYPDVSAMMRRRVNRLLALRGNILFIRTNMNPTQIVELGNILKNKYSAPRGGGVLIDCKSYTQFFSKKN